MIKKLLKMSCMVLLALAVWVIPCQSQSLPTSPHFSIVVLPDTQFYSANPGDIMFLEQTQWVVDHKDSDNIVYVVHVGDIVDSEGGYSQWAEVAQYAMDFLRTYNIPFGMAVGNHDQTSSFEAMAPCGSVTYGTTPNYNTYFGKEYFLKDWLNFSKNNWGNYFHPEPSTTCSKYGNNYENHIDYISAAGMKFALIFIETFDGDYVNTDYYCTTGKSNASWVVNWADDFLTYNKDRRGIVVGHALLTPAELINPNVPCKYYGNFSGAQGQGQYIYNGVKYNNNDHSPNLFLMLAGHVEVLGCTDGVEIIKNDLNTNLNSFAACYHYHAGPDPSVYSDGDAKMAILRFYPTENKIYVETGFTPWSNNESSTYIFDYVMPDGSISAPASAQIWQLNTSENITWACNDVTGNVKLELLRNGKVLGTIVSSCPVANNSYSWQVGTYTYAGTIYTASSGDGYSIRLSTLLESGVNDYNAFTVDSTDTFSISDTATTAVTVVSPNGGEEWIAGTEQEIRWKTSGSVANVRIRLSTDNGATYTTLTDSAPNTGSFFYTVPSSLSTQCKIRVRNTGGTQLDDSDSTYVIAANGCGAWNNCVYATPSELELIEAMTYDNGLFVGVGKDGLIITSTDGKNWVKQTSNVTVTLYDVDYIKSQFIIVGASGNVLTSSNGINWTKVITTFYEKDSNGDFVATNPVQFHLYALTYGDSRYIASCPGTVKFGTTYVSRFFKSMDMVNWYELTYTSSSPRHLYDIAYGGSEFVAVGKDGLILTSQVGSNGTWISRTSNTTNTLYGVTYNGFQFVAVGEGGTILTSNDGIVWATQTSGTYNTLNDVKWAGPVYTQPGESKYIAVGIGGTILTSTNGINWVSQTSGTSMGLYSVTYGQSRFAVGGVYTLRYSNCIIEL